MILHQADRGPARSLYFRDFGIFRSARMARHGRDSGELMFRAGIRLTNRYPTVIGVAAPPIACTTDLRRLRRRIFKPYDSIPYARPITRPSKTRAKTASVVVNAGCNRL